MPETKQKNATIIAFELCEVIGTDQSSDQKAARILALIDEALALDSEWVGEASGLALVVYSLAKGILTDMQKGASLADDENARAFYQKIIEAIASLAAKGSDIIEKNTDFASINATANAAGSAALN